VKKLRGKSPIRERPLRSPGQSVRDEIERVLTEEIGVWVFVPLFAVVLSLLEWLRAVGRFGPDPRGYSALAVLVMAYSLWRLQCAKTKLRQLRLGWDGERTVAEVLDSLRSDGAVVLHDVPGEGFNVDHVLFSRHGIYAIETKTLSKRQGASITLDRETVLVDGHRPDRDPVTQAKAAAEWIRSILARSTGVTFPVRPVVVFPGWYVEPMKHRDSTEIWILNPKALPAFVDQEPVQLSETDLSLAVFHLSRYIRTTVP